MTPGEIKSRLRELEDINTNRNLQITAWIDYMYERLKEDAFEQESQKRTTIEIGEDHG